MVIEVLESVSDSLSVNGGLREGQNLTLVNFEGSASGLIVERVSASCRTHCIAPFLQNGIAVLETYGRQFGATRGSTGKCIM